MERGKNWERNQSGMSRKFRKNDEESELKRNVSKDRSSELKNEQMKR